jgi:hypothetical protein
MNTRTDATSATNVLFSSHHEAETLVVLAKIPMTNKIPLLENNFWEMESVLTEIKIRVSKSLQLTLGFVRYHFFSKLSNYYPVKGYYII